MDKIAPVKRNMNESEDGVYTVTFKPGGYYRHIGAYLPTLFPASNLALAKSKARAI
jgi:hypothetical protein